MPTPIRIPIYSNLSHKAKQQVNMVLGGLVFVSVALVVSGMVGGGDKGTPSAKDLPKPKSLTGVPGQQLDPKDAWIGGAGKDLAQLKDDVRTKAGEVELLRNQLKQEREQLRDEIKELRERGFLNKAPEAAGAAGASGTKPGSATGATPPANASAGTSTAGTPRQGPEAFPSTRATRAMSAAAQAFPPGSPGIPTPYGGPAGPGGNLRAPAGTGPVDATPEFAPPALIRVSMASEDRTAGANNSPGGALPGSTAATGSARTTPPKTVANFMPVGFTRAVVLGGLAAPTGGQAQSNPIPVLLRLVDYGVLPNGYRSQVKDCLVVGEGFGDASAERAYIRTTLLSCVLLDGRIVEVPIKGSIFGEDGMNGMMGKLITKQGAILANALLAGVASGIGGGVAQATQSISQTTLGQVNSSPTDTNGILRQGLGTGVGKALDRLAQYYINLAERTFPVIEVQPGRTVDVVIQQGISVEATLAFAPGGEATAPVRGSSPDNDRSRLMRTVSAGSEDD